VRRNSGQGKPKMLDFETRSSVHSDMSVTGLEENANLQAVLAQISYFESWKIIPSVWRLPVRNRLTP
jgi:hypothetical protein